MTTASRVHYTKPNLWTSILVLVSVVLALCWLAAAVDCMNVTWDHRALIIDGKRRFLQSGSIHYPRSTPEMWPQLMNLAKEGGLDMVETYVFWDRHEPQRGTYNFAGNYNLVKFVKLAAAAGLFVNLRIGPYVCAEWNFGGFPAWLRFMPGIELRTNNEVFKEEMERFVTLIVKLMKDEKLFASQGGPIILAQIENEYGNIDYEYGYSGYVYMRWAADMAQGLNTGVPWIMCQQNNAPENIINTCNGFYCDSFMPNNYSKPQFWTENWSGWYQEWGRPSRRRPAEDVAFAVARFFQKGGSLQNYYMYHGGTNFGRTAGEWVTTSYDYDAPINEYGEPSQPKWGHLKELHAVLKLCEPALAAVDDFPIQLSLGDLIEVHIYSDGKGDNIQDIIDNSTACVAFIANGHGNMSSPAVLFNGYSYDLPAWSVSILPDCRNVAFNTAKVTAQTTVTKAVPASRKLGSSQKRTRMSGVTIKDEDTLQWEFYQEPGPAAWVDGAMSFGGLLEQINVTKDTTDYLWYTTSVEVPSSSDGEVLIKGIRDTFHLFLNGEYAGSPNRSFRSNHTVPVKLLQGNNNISILSTTVGLQNYGARLEREAAGITDIELRGVLHSATFNLTHKLWEIEIGTYGENLSLHTDAGAKSVTWQKGMLPANQPLVWYKTTVDAPLGDSPVILDLGSMGKGQAWINGQSIGRYWTLPKSAVDSFPGDNCHSDCSYAGGYNPARCAYGCGEPSQRWYHVPRAWLQPIDNVLVIFEETGGDVSKVGIATREIDRVCAQMEEVLAPTSRPPSPRSKSSNAALPSGPDRLESSKRQILLDCSPGYQISEVVFGSFGNPDGQCENFQRGSCHAPMSAQILHMECVGKEKCFLEVSWARFALMDPCPGTTKSLAVEALCSPSPSSPP